MKVRSLTALLPLALLLSGCEESIVGPITDLPRPLSSAEREVIRASNSFAFDLLREVNRDEQDGNIFISPLSASMALGMTMNGARGETFHAMVGTLGFAGLSQPEINASYRSLIDLLRGLDPKVQILVANSVWYADSFRFEQAFFDTTRTYFDAEVAGLDFGDPRSVDRINAWVEEQTRGKITSILEAINPYDVMYLINAIYFKGDWTTQFARSETRAASFLDSSGQREVGTVQMMHRQGPIQHYRGDGFEAADLPYGGGAFSLTVILPDRGVDVNAALESLSSERWSAMVEGFAEANLEIHLPKFRLEYEKQLEDPLTALGMGIAFTGAADFSGMSPAGLSITEVLQKTFINVDEEGTEAAAVTKVTMGVTSGPPAFVVNRPFVFAIRERFSGSILFMGKMMLPEAK